MGLKLFLFNLKDNFNLEALRTITIKPFSKRNKMKQLSIISVVMLCSFSNYILAQQSIQVPDDYATIQEALDAAETETIILVGPGIYYENLIWPDDVNGIELIAMEGKNRTVIDGGGLDRVITVEGSLGFNFLTYLKGGIEGFTIRNGFAPQGAGLIVRKANMRLFNLRFYNNRSEGSEGAGAFIEQFAGVIEDCDFENNTIFSSTLGHGAGLYMNVRGNTVIKNCHFKNNLINSLGSGEGGGLYLGRSGTIIPLIDVINCSFIENSMTASSTEGAGLATQDFQNYILNIENSIFARNKCLSTSNSEGGALNTSAGDLNIRKCIFRENQALQGAAIDLNGTVSENRTGIIENTIFSRNINSENSESGVINVKGYDNLSLRLNNCIMDHSIGNSMYLEHFTVAHKIELFLNHCTFAYNQGKITSNDISEIECTASNSIFWENEENEFGGWSNWNDKIFQNCCADIFPLEDGNFYDDPQFLSQNLLIPLETSPCINAGSADVLDADLSGLSRPMPSNSLPDVGAYEFDQYFAHALVKFYFDENENGVKDADEVYSSFGSFIIGDETYNNFRKEGVFAIVPQGTVELKYNSAWDTRWRTTGEDTFTLLVDSDDFSASIEIGLAAIVEQHDVNSAMTGEAFRCGEEVDFTICVQNQGTEIADGRVWLHLDQRIEEYTFDIEPDFIANDHLVYWDFFNLYPGESLKIDFVVTAPLIQTAEEVGELYCFLVEVEVPNNGPSRFPFKTELRCAYDPNDKLVNPYREDNLSLLESDLVYTIRFQNTGNDYARNVVVRDTIDENLDMSSFDLISTSHPDHLKIIIEDERAVKFEFNGIYLLDSLTNEPESHGFIHYRIAPIEGTELNTNITNTAHIYFDFNPPIVTNTTSNIMVDEFPVVAIKSLANLSIQSFPNPTTDVIHMSRKVDQVRVFDTQGKLVFKADDTQRVDLKHLVNGIYFVEFKIGDVKATAKWLVQK